MSTTVPQGLDVRLSITDSCQFRCLYCLPEGERHRHLPDTLSGDEVIQLITRLHQTAGIRKLRFTGGEPLLRKDLPDLIRCAVDLDIPDIALTSNGQQLAERAAELKAAGLQRVNLSLDSLDPATFKRLSRGGDLNKTLEGIRTAQEMRLGPVKLNMVVMRGQNDQELEAMLQFGLETGCEVRFLEMMPVGEAREKFDLQFVSADEIRSRLESLVEWTPLVGELSQSSRNYRVRDARGRETVCGFITSYSHDFCEGCRRMRISSDGYLLGCLARGERQSLRPVLDADDPAPILVELLNDAMTVKTGFRFADGQGADSMAAIGG